ncbi:MAG: PKD domain-containing protein [Flavobacteriales bacterium]|nr:PKD domain-containing protein [Flavobacteriales bacterium]
MNRLFLALTIIFSTSILRMSAQTCTGLGSTDFSDIVYVSLTGQSSSAGTADDPTDLLTAMSMLGGNTDKIYIQGGTYLLSNQLVMQSNAQLIGGFNSDWVKDNSAITTIYRDANNIQVGPNRLVGIECVSINNFRLQDLTIQVASGQGLGTSVYGIYLNNCADYSLVRCKIISGNGGHGVNGAPGVTGINGAPGEPGQDGQEDSYGNRLGGAGGGGSFPGSHAGGSGGDGGIRGTYQFPAGGQAFPGDSGLDGSGPGGGLGAAGGQGNFRNVTPVSCDRTSNNDGLFGADGSGGQLGTPGSPGVYSFGGGFFQPATGTSGTAGEHGSGGGGGGGGGSSGGIVYVYIPWPVDDTIPPNLNGTGPGGGGGGEGGERGYGGQGGQGAGGSFGVFLWDNGLNGVMKDCEIEIGSAGIGGNGGLGGNGGNGGAGGEGGALYTACLIGAGGSGGSGGNGGRGGDGGKGSNGIVDDLYQHPGGQPLSIQNIYGIQQPAVNVEFGGCTNAPVTFSTDASGTIQWFFGAGSNPVMAHGQEAVTSFSTPGFKTFTLVVNGIAFTYTDFIDIHAVVPPLNPEILTGPTDLCAGDIADFNSSVSANNYIWQLRNIEGDTVTYNGPNFYNLLGVSFDTAGVYELTLTTETECCGQSFTDTVMIHVDSIVLPEIAIQTNFADSTNTVCELTEVTFTATATDVGLSPTYNWMINGNASGGNAPVFTTDQLLNQDIVTCQVVSSLGCATGEIALSNQESINVIPPVVLTCSSDSFLQNEPTFFEAAVASGGLAPYNYYWTFGDGSLGFGDTVQHIYQETGVYTATVDVVDSLGCTASCQTFLTISPNLAAGFEVDSIVGCAPFTVNFTNTSFNAVSNYWNFGDGSGSTEENPTHTYQTAGTYDVDLFVYSGSGNDSVSVMQQIHVNPSPVANFSNFEVNHETGSDTVQFADNSVFAVSWYWDFDDPASGPLNNSTEQNPLHVFNSNGQYDVSLVVTNIYGCSDSITKTSSVNVGLQDVPDAVGFSVYPNPVSESLNVSFEANEAKVASYTIVDLRGRPVQHGTLNVVSGKNKSVVDVTQLASGSYVLSLQIGNTEVQTHFVVSAN